MMDSSKVDSAEKEPVSEHIMPAGEEEYAYPALPPGSIRIMNLHPGKGDEVLQCDIQVVYLDNLPPYEALSCVWGNPMPRRTLLLGDK